MCAGPKDALCLRPPSLFFKHSAEWWCPGYRGQRQRGRTRWQLQLSYVFYTCIYVWFFLHDISNVQRSLCHVNPAHYHQMNDSFHSQDSDYGCSLISAATINLWVRQISRPVERLLSTPEVIRLNRHKTSSLLSCSVKAGSPTTGRPFWQFETFQL